MQSERPISDKFLMVWRNTLAEDIVLKDLNSLLYELQSTNRLEMDYEGNFIYGNQEQIDKVKGTIEFRTRQINSHFQEISCLFH